MLSPGSDRPENLLPVGRVGKVPLPPIPADSLLLCAYPPNGVSAPRGGSRAIYFMFKYRMYGSAVVSLPLIALIAVAISISVGTGVGEPSAYGVYGDWVIGGCVVALIAQLWGFLRALRRVRRAPEQPEVLSRALSRGPMLVWLYLLVLLVQYGRSRDMASLVMAGIVLGIALLTHLAVRGSRRGRVTIDRSSSVGIGSVSD
jgi:hypothetical protein